MRCDDESASILKSDRSPGGEKILLNPKSLAHVIAVLLSSTDKETLRYKIVFFS